MLKKTILATVTGAAVLASGATFADNGRHLGHYKHGHRNVVVKHVYHQPAPRHVVVQRHYYARPAPVVVHRPVYVERPVVYRPAPVVHYSNDGLAILAGAVIGGAIAYQIANH